MKSSVILWGAATAAAAIAQMGPESRGIVPEEVIQARPQSKTGAVVARPKYQAISPAVAASLRQPSAARQMGVTIWRLRAPGPSDAGARILVQEEARSEEWVPERVASSSSLKAGDRVRLSVESPEAGYLYVIDRERYATGERGDPYLIFPTSRTRNGDNRVVAGRLIDIPAQDDRPSFFSLRQSRPDQTEEELTMLLTREPLADLEITSKAMALSKEQVARWEKQAGGGKVEVFELAGGTGKAWTRAEQEAGAGGSRLLTQDDPPPQTIYRVAARPEQELMVTVRLRYSAGHAR